MLATSFMDGEVGCEELWCEGRRIGEQERRMEVGKKFRYCGMQNVQGNLGE